jgi:hypothetical protein
MFQSEFVSIKSRGAVQIFNPDRDLSDFRKRESGLSVHIVFPPIRLFVTLRKDASILVSEERPYREAFCLE